MMAERQVSVSHTTIMRWVLRFVPEFLNREIAKAANFPEVTERLETLGFQVDTGTAEDFNRYIASETEKWRKVIAKTNIQTQ
jgi:tripartite-type tricarboxylate transporter receptor subunit TctC